MPIRYTNHARSRMQSRGITEADVLAVLSEHYLSVNGRGSIVYRGNVGGREIAVVTVPPGVKASQIYIKTVWVT
ncbi:DUF4258 domain-containing protein [Mycobacteroides abscessus]|uniref:DUF4258 domain-containing protein n=1 Tax=Mycobacteroides abscessus TaxID=36809 RepID=UPI0009A86BA7|nr:Uncharacterised protein [Mycobacteroides abscessus subsp. massiliense]